MTELTPEQMAQNASQPGVFSLIERLQGRNMPTEQVSIFIDEAAAWEVQQLEEEAATTRDEDQLAELEAQIEAARAAVKASEVVFTMRAVSSKVYDELIDQTYASFPKKFEKVVNPMTGRTTQELIASPDRESLFNRIYLAECIVSVKMGNDIDDSITPEWVKQFEDFAPLDALRLVTTTAYKLRMSSEWMDHYQDEDFSPKP